MTLTHQPKYQTDDRISTLYPNHLKKKDQNPYTGIYYHICVPKIRSPYSINHYNRQTLKNLISLTPFDFPNYPETQRTHHQHEYEVLIDGFTVQVLPKQECRDDKPNRVQQEINGFTLSHSKWGINGGGVRQSVPPLTIITVEQYQPHPPSSP